jgi:hypothetical protein
VSVIEWSRPIFLEMMFGVIVSPILCELCELCDLLCEYLMCDSSGVMWCIKKAIRVNCNGRVIYW